MQLTLDRMGRIVVPKAIRDRFNLNPGDELHLTLKPDGLHLRPALPVSTLTEENGTLVCCSDLPASAWDIPAFLEDQRTQRNLELGGL